ncbi:hypothetical protein GCM10027276_17310 [Comamonas piscis]
MSLNQLHCIVEVPTQNPSGVWQQSDLRAAPADTAPHTGGDAQGFRIVVRPAALPRRARAIATQNYDENPLDWPSKPAGIHCGASAKSPAVA